MRIPKCQHGGSKVPNWHFWDVLISNAKEIWIMGNKFQKLLYNLSAAAPVCFVFSIVWLIQKKTWQLPVVCVAIAIAIILLFYKSFEYGLKNLSPIPIRTADISPNDNWIVIYILTYLLPFASIVIDDFNLIVCSAIALLIAIVAPFINSAIPNPLLFIKKYHFYQVGGEHGISGYILITRKKYRSKQELKTVNRMFDFLLLDAERK